MAVANKLSTNSYATLLTDIETLYTNARRAIVEMYWNIGKRIVEAEQDGEIRAPYGTGLIAGLSKDLTEKVGEGFSVRNLARMRKLYIENPILPRVAKLSLAQNLALLSVKDLKRRRLLEQKAIKEDLTRDELLVLAQKENVAQAVSENLADPEKPVPQLKVTRGELGTYSIIDTSKVLCPRGSVVLDLGFNIWRLVERAATKDFTITEKPQYTYTASVERVIDGDTIVAQIECGFDTVIREKLRLRGIDCPEIDTPEGKKAKDFTAKKLPAGSSIIITTHKDDKYGRYLADVFFGDEKIFLNQELLNSHLAVTM